MDGQQADNNQQQQQQQADNNQQQQQQQQQVDNNQQQADNGNASTGYQSIIEQQAAQIDALMNQTKSLNDQIVKLINGGSQIGQAQQQQEQQQPMQMFNPDSLSSDEDYSLEALAKEIGKR